MKNPNHSGYVGDVDKIKELCHELLDNMGLYRDVFTSVMKFFEKNDLERSIKMRDFFDRSEIFFPKSYQDLWLSGLVEATEITNNLIYFCGYRQYVYPLDVKNINQEPYFSDSFEVIKCILDNYEITTIDNYYQYPNDEYSSAIGPESKYSLEKAIVIATNDIAGNSGLGLLYQNSFSIDGENEASVVDYSEGAIFRFRSFAEMFFLRSFVNITNESDCASYEDLLKSNKAYSLIFKL